MKRRIFPLSHGAFRPEGSEAQSVSDPVFHQEDLFAPATLDATRHAARDVSLYRGSQSRPSTSPETTQWRPFSLSSASRDALNLRLFLLRRSALKPSSWVRFTPQKKSPDLPRGFFGGRSLSSLCGPVGFRGVAPHHRPIHPEHFHRRFHMDRFPVGGVYYQLNRYVVGMLRYLDDWLILAESRTTGIQARNRLLQVCEELGLQVIAESRP